MGEQDLKLVRQDGTVVAEFPYMEGTGIRPTYDANGIIKAGIQIHVDGLANVAPDRGSRLTYIDGTGAAREDGKATLIHAGVPIADLLQVREGYDYDAYMRLSATLLENALYQAHVANPKRPEAYRKKYENQFASGLANEDKVAEYKDAVAKASVLNEDVKQALEGYFAIYRGRKNVDIMSVIQGACGLLDEFDRLESKTPEQQKYAHARTVAVAPILLAMANWSILDGKSSFENFPYPEYSKDFSFTKNCATMMGIPHDHPHLTTLDFACALHADHEMNNSTFTAKAVHSGVNRFWNIAGANDSALHGELHGYANAKVMEAYDVILALPAEEIAKYGSLTELYSAVDMKQVQSIANQVQQQNTISQEELEARSRAYLKVFVDYKRKVRAEDPKAVIADVVAGKGHAVYKVEDPRIIPLQYCLQLLEGNNKSARYRVWEAVNTAQKDFPETAKLPNNIDSLSGAGLLHIVKRELFTPVFWAFRMAGQIAQCIERSGEGLYRATQRYIGPPETPYATSYLNAEATARGMELASLIEEIDQADVRGDLPSARGLTHVSISSLKNLVNEHRNYQAGTQRG